MMHQTPVVQQLCRCRFDVVSLRKNPASPVFPSTLGMILSMVMASLPVLHSQSSLTNFETLSPVEQRAVEMIADGHNHRELAKKLGKGDPAKTKYWRQRFRDLNWAVIAIASTDAQITASAGIVPVMDAVVKRAKRGRIDAAKVVFEVTGFHNPRVQHEHSGEIEVKITGLNRPSTVETQDSVVDATVVED